MYSNTPITPNDFRLLKQCIMINAAENVDAETLIAVIKQSFMVDLPPSITSAAVNTKSIDTMMNILEILTTEATYDLLVKMYMLLAPHFINPRLTESLKDSEGRPVKLKLPLPKIQEAPVSKPDKPKQIKENPDNTESVEKNNK